MSDIDKKAIHERAKEIVRKKSQVFHDFSQEEAEKILLDLEIHQIELEMQNEELRAIQAKLSAVKERYFNLYDMAPVSYCTLNEKGLITESNLTASLLLGFERSKLYMRPMSDFIFREDQDKYYLNKKKIIASGKPKSCELRLVKSDGSLCWVLISATLSIEKSTDSVICLAMTDITNKKYMQEQLENKKKMMLIQSRYATMGGMISMIAHQWRQPLNVVGLAVANIQTKQELGILDEKSIEENTVIIADNITFMSDTIDDFRNYFKPDAPKERTNIQSVIDTVFKIIGKSLENNEIAFNVEDNSKNGLLIHKNSFVQALLNIVSNAKDALISNHVASAYINITVNETPDSIVLSICDNARGIPDNIITKINEPYFSTKALSGTGLGLYISETIVEQHLFGTLTWHNEDRGACFIITLKKDDNKE